MVNNKGEGAISESFRPFFETTRGVEECLIGDTTSDTSTSLTRTNPDHYRARSTTLILSGDTFTLEKSFTTTAATMADTPNGSLPQTPKSPKLTNWALTEYSANVPDIETRKHDIVPNQFLLPNGQPDV